MITIDNDILIYEMETILSRDSGLYHLWDKDEEENILQNLLIEYAPKLFNTILDPENIESYMLTLSTMIHNYKEMQLRMKIGDFGFENYPTIYKKDKEKIPIAIQANIKKLIDLMGGEEISTKKGTELKNLLCDAYDNPTEYIPKKESTTASKDNIDKFLRGLHLPDKTNVITEFMLKIK